MFVFNNSEDRDLRAYQYELYEEDQVTGTYPNISLITNATPLSSGNSNSSVFTIAVNGSYIDELGVEQPKNYYGRVRSIDTSSNLGEWTLILKTDQSTPLIDEQYIVSLTADRIKAGTIESAEIVLGGANPATTIIKSTTFDGTAILDGLGNPTGSYLNATTGWLINGQGKSYFYDTTIAGSIDIGGFDSSSFHVNTSGDIWSGEGTFDTATNPFSVTSAGLITAKTGKIGPVNITTSSMNSQGSSPYQNPNNNYYRFDQFGDITVYSNPGTDVGTTPLTGLFHVTNIVGEYINVQKHSSASYNSSPTLLGAFMGNATGSAMEFSLTEGSITKFIVTTAGNLNVTGTISGAVKSFEINHPLYSDKKLVHASIEGPTLDVFYRGTSELINGKVEIELPEYFEALTKKEGRTVFLTPEVDNGNTQVAQIAYSTIDNGKFKVFEVNGTKNPFQKFSWLVMATRSDTGFEVVQDK